MVATFIGAANDPATGDTQQSSRAVQKPAGAQIVSFFVMLWEGDGAKTITPPSGAVLRDNTKVDDQRVATYLRYVGGDATGTTYTFSFSASAWSSLKAIFFADVDAALDLATVPFNTANAGGTGYASVSVTTVDGAALAWGGSEDSSGLTHTPPTGFTETHDASWSTAAYRISPGDGSQVASGATTSSAVDGKISTLVALAPAGAGTPVTLNDTPTGIRLGGVVAVEVLVAVDVMDRPTGIRLSGPTEFGVVPTITLNDTPTGIRLSGIDDVDVVVSSVLSDFPTGLHLIGPAETEVLVGLQIVDSPTGIRLSGPTESSVSDVFINDSPTGVRLSGPAETVNIVAGDALQVFDTPTGLRLSGPDSSLTLDIFISDSPTGARLSGPTETLAVDVTFLDSPAGTRLSGPVETSTVGVVLTDLATGLRLSGPAGTIDATANVVFTDAPTGLRLSGPSEPMPVYMLDTPTGLRLSGPDITSVGELVLAAIITGVDITGVGIKTLPVVNGLAVARQASGPAGHRTAFGPKRVAIIVTGIGSAGGLIVVRGVGGKSTPTANGIAVVRHVFGPKISRVVTGPKVGPE